MRSILSRRPFSEAMVDMIVKNLERSWSHRRVEASRACAWHSSRTWSSEAEELPLLA